MWKRKVNKSRLEKHPIITTWVPISVSVLSLFLSVGSFYLSVTAEISRAENVEVSIHPIWRGYKSDIKPAPGLPGWFLLTTHWNVLMANTSDRAISIVSYEVGELYNNYFSRSLEIYQGLVTREDGPVNLPINLDSGQSTMLKVKVGLRVHSEIYDFIMSDLAGSEHFRIEDLNGQLLRKRGIDFYQNDLTRNYMHLGHGSKIIPYPGDNPKQEYIVLKVRTSRGNVYSSTSSWYDREALLNAPDIGMDLFDLERLRLTMPNKGMERDAP